MTLSDLAAVATIVGGLAVTFTLIYVARQLRLAEKIQRSVIQQGRANRVSHQLLSMSEPTLAAIWMKGAREPESLTDEELERFMIVARGAFISAEDSYLQHKAGLMDDSAFRSFAAGAKGMLSGSAGLRAAWRMTSSHYDVGFVDFMDAVLAEAPHQAPQDRMTIWAMHVKADSAEPPAG